ncbi:hypothetical protein FAI41_06660 [Acetobacteraceae bacterium]|nr:hypothetical protein FAI41_06660 [Acetobacteraceae bacterium]
MPLEKTNSENNHKESTIILSIRYAGSAVEGSINATELGNSLAGFGTLLEQASSVLYSSSASVSARVQTNFEHGSFIAYLELAYHFWEPVRDFINSPDYQAIKSLAETIGLLGLRKGLPASINSLISFIKYLQKRKITEEKSSFDMMEILIINQDGDPEKISVSKDIWKLFKSLKARSALQETLSPLKHSGIDEITFHISGTPESQKTIVTKDEYASFEIPLNEKVLIDERVREKILEVIAINFEGTSWQFREENKKKKIKAAITDSVFIRSVNNDEISFKKGDTITCLLKIFTYETLKGNKIEYEITKVLKLGRNPFTRISQPRFNF